MDLEDYHFCGYTSNDNYLNASDDANKCIRRWI